MAAETVIENPDATAAATIKIDVNDAYMAACGLRGLIKQWLVGPEETIDSKDEQVKPNIADCVLTASQLDGDAAIGMEILANVIDAKLEAVLSALEPRERQPRNAALREAYALAGGLGMMFNRAVMASDLEGEEGLLAFVAADRVVDLCDRWSVAT